MASYAWQTENQRSVSESLQCLAKTGTDGVNETSLLSLTITDEAGRYRLEDLPPGRYYVVAGRVDAPTYYPGVQSATNAISVAVIDSTPQFDLDFQVAESSARLPIGLLSQFLSSVRSVNVKGRITIAAGSEGVQLPGYVLFVAKTDVSFNLTTYGNYHSAISSDGTFQIPLPEGPPTLLSLRTGIPAGYSVKSMTFGAKDLMKERLDIKLAGPAMPEIVITIETDPTGRQD